MADTGVTPPSRGDEPPEGVDRNGAAATDMPAWVPRAIRLTIFWVLLTGIAVLLLIQLEDLARYLVLALFLAFALEPAVQWLHTKHGWRRGTATGAILSGAVVLGVATFVFILPRAVDQVGQMVAEIPEWAEEINDWSEDVFGEELISEPSEDSAEDTGGHVRDFVANYGDDILGAVSGAVGAIFALFTVLLFAFYLTANGPEVRRAVASRLRPESQRRVLWAWEEAIVKTGGYLYSRMLLAMINGTLIFIVMKIVDVPFALALAVFTGVVAAFIPIVGTYIAGALPIFVALVSVGLSAAIVLLIEVLIYQQLENYWLSPRLSQKTIDLNAGMAYGVAMAGGALGGIVAAFFALPVAAVIQSFMANYAKRYDLVDDGEISSPDTRAPSTSPHST